LGNNKELNPKGHRIFSNDEAKYVTPHREITDLLK
jgi:hypothetical protein